MRKAHALILAPLLLGLAAGMTACSLMPSKSFPVAKHVDLDRFMGPWYVIAHIPPSKTKNSYNAIERYTRSADAPDTIHVRFTYNEGSFDGKVHTMQPTGHVLADSGNAVWGMQFFWPIKLQYVISYVDPNYQTTIIARQRRDYVWIMARTPQIDDATYKSLVRQVKDLGYDTTQLRKVPQQPLSQRHDL